MGLLAESLRCRTGKAQVVNKVVDLVIYTFVLQFDQTNSRIQTNIDSSRPLSTSWHLAPTRLYQALGALEELAGSATYVRTLAALACTREGRASESWFESCSLAGSDW